MIAIRPTLARNAPVLVSQFRPVTTESIPAAEAGSIVAAQRKHRPISPHLGIYKPQITWYLSSLTRITGAILSGGKSNHMPPPLILGLYCFGAAYLVSPLFGWH